MKALVFTLGLLVASAPPAAAGEPIKWIVSTTGGSQIQIPSFFADGKVEHMDVTANGTRFQPKSYPDVQFDQYKPNSTANPYDEIEAMFINDDDDYHIYYKLDKRDLGVISGTRVNSNVIFYGMCQKHDDQNFICFDLTWNMKDQAIFGPIAKRIARSFRKNG
ncbi:hypothetical protein [Mesorhizobium sp. M2C.T.Ca.TU.002.02.1.1]|uniref:hypothetical protein n=1 Tax=Mesorhizobium sp. M2C.T.Ca.TU.002.02.1.1 TaxID=2496788 RepID=UPI000FC9EA44|nr:hypothetical protein [Mesorhizobium sp. M2C.T.Ca.TU.002.02.1.1]RUU50125.1 hypothetical protein EOD07_32830 [Mesorhizobium sp. M2C.T.Ca.TU.002.02.1.1]RUU61936.1 hypothetical protein EOD04_25620 [Mesorhizobium sp. M2C.T.Ca.TU.009.01.2.1]